MYRTELATKDEFQNWNQIVSRCPYSEALHTLEWRDTLSKSFKQMEPLYFVIKNQDNIVGASPCFIFSPIPFSRTLLSMPWMLPGGLLSFPETDCESAITSVLHKLDDVSRERHLSEITVTLPANSNEVIINSLNSNGYIQNTSQFTHILSIENGYESVWTAYNKRVRGAVRKAEKTGIIVRETENEEEMMCFYKMYLEMISRFNSTPKPYSLLRYLQTSPIARMVIALLDNHIIGGLLFLHFNSCVRLWCETSDPKFLNYRPNNAIINYIVQWSCNNGYRFVDFGASPPGNEGLVAFKEEWGATKAWFSTFTKIYSPWRKRLWTASEPSVRRIYAAIQRFRV